MNVFRVLIRLVVISACTGALAFFSGCATTGKPANSSAKPAARVSAPLTPEVKPAPAPVKETTPPPAAVPAKPMTANPAPAPVNAAAAEPAAALPAILIPVRHATIIGSQETSILLDNFTAFVASVDGRKVEAGRNGWNVPLSIDVGHRTLGVEFNRGVFRARGQLDFDAAANARYELKYATDAELFGKNSYCNFWVTEIQSGQTVSLVSKASVEKIADAPAPRQSLLP